MAQVIKPQIGETMADANCIDMIQSHRGFSLRKAA